MKVLNPLTIPLKGIQLIEASAGTGKTYTITILFLRILLEKNLGVDQILVVTFTNAATEELRARVRKTLRESIDILDGHPSTNTLLSQVLNNFKAESQKTAAVLNDALTRMDEAAIYTIHGFCQRTLQEHAFESGSCFELEFLESEQELLIQIIQDFWRQRFYSVSLAESRWLRSKWGSPEVLLQTLQVPLARPEAKCIPEISAQELESTLKTCTSLFQAVQAKWPEVRTEIEQIFQNDKALSKNKKDGYHPDRVTATFAAMDLLAAADEMEWSLPSGLSYLACSVMEKKLLKNGSLPQHSFFELFDQFFSQHQNFLANYAFYLQYEALHFAQQELEKRKQEQSALYFNDLLIQMERGLNGPDGLQLRAILSKRYPLACVDEFQDTDPLQYKIFSTIYKDAHHGGLFMIGDPKQAIYSFRGGDIFTYIKAKRNTAPNCCFTMDTNYRATIKMVDAVNTLFDTQAPFLYDDDIHFAPVQAAGIADVTSLLINGSPPCPLNLLWLDPEGLATKPGKPIAKAKAEIAAASFSAQKITSLLTEKNTIGDKEHFKCFLYAEFCLYQP